MNVSKMSSSATRPERVTLTTLPAELQATPFQELQQSVEDIHDCSSCDGSAMMLFLNPSKASLSIALQASQAGGEKDGDNNREKSREKILV